MKELASEPIYKPGDLLLKIRQDDYWFDHVIILEVENLEEYQENVYQLFTSDGQIERRTVEWVQLNYRREDEIAKDYTEMDQETV